jgi:hypothetical protein
MQFYGIYPREPEKFVGKLFRVFSWSHLLEFTKRATVASEFYPGPLGHYEIACQNHVVDVISTAPPRIIGAIETDPDCLRQTLPR